MYHWYKALSLEAVLVARGIAGSIAMRRAAIFLLPYIGVIIGLDVAAHYGSVTDAHLPVQFFISQDRSFGEFLEYAFTAAISVMLIVMWRRTGAVAYLANAVLFVWLTADNSLEIHEGYGHWIAALLPLPMDFPIQANDIGEAMLFGMVGLLWLAGLGASLRAAHLRPLIHALILAGCIVIAASFGVILDIVVGSGEHTALMLEFLTWLEDGGEFAIICLSFFLALGMFNSERRVTDDQNGHTVMSAMASGP